MGINGSVAESKINMISTRRYITIHIQHFHSIVHYQFQFWTVFKLETEVDTFSKLSFVRRRYFTPQTPPI